MKRKFNAMKRKKNKEHLSSGEFYFAAMKCMRLSDAKEATLETPNGEFYLRPGALVLRELNKQNAQRIMGLLEAEALGRSPVSIVKFNLPATLKTSCDHDYSISCLERWNHIDIASFLLSLWCVKDNAVSPDLTFLALTSSLGETRFANYTSGVHCLDARGQQSETTWSIADLNHAVSYNSVLNEILSRFRIHDDGRPHTFAVRTKSRVGRFFHILSSAARKEIDLALRISFFVQALEVLFATTTTELSYRLSLRIAFSLSETNDRRADIYSLMKDAYCTRSTVLHGDAFKESHVQRLPELCRRIEELVREVARMILGHPVLLDLFERSGDELEKSFTKLVIDSGETILGVAEELNLRSKKPA